LSPSVRNTYTLLDFGNWVDVSSNDRSDPYVQFLPVTNVRDAVADFVQVRLGGVDTTGAPQYALLPPSQMQHSPVSAEEKKKKYQEMVLSRWPYILAGCAVLVVLLLGLIVWRCCCRSRRAKKSRATAGTSIYVSLEEQGGKGMHGSGYMEHGYSG
jgi:hypothetical protein